MCWIFPFYNVFYFWTKSLAQNRKHLFCAFLCISALSLPQSLIIGLQQATIPQVFSMHRMAVVRGLSGSLEVIMNLLMNHVSRNTWVSDAFRTQADFSILCTLWKKGFLLWEWVSACSTLLGRSCLNKRSERPRTKSFLCRVLSLEAGASSHQIPIPFNSVFYSAMPAKLLLHPAEESGIKTLMQQ